MPQNNWEDMFNKAASTLTKSKDIELWEAYKANPGPHTLQPLMRQLDPVLQNEINKWTGALARPVLETKARNLTLEAIKTYNPNAGAALATHVVNRLQKLSRDVYTHQDAVRLPEYKKLKVHSYVRAERELTDTYGREPTHQEMADHLAWSPKMLSEVQKSLQPELLASQDMGAGLFESPSAWGNASSNGLIDFVYHDLAPVDKLIFEHSTGYSGKPIYNNTQLRKATGLTQGQLSYHKKKVIEQFKRIGEE